MQTTTARPLSRLPDRALLARTRQLVGQERHLHVEIVDHLREIEDRDLHLARGFSTLFDYAVNELGYSNGAAWRRTLAMRLCRRMADVRERLLNGSLTLSTAAQLQSAFERQERKRRRAWVQQQKRNARTAASTAAPEAALAGQSPDRLPAGTAASPLPTVGSVRAQAPVVVLDATGQRELIKQATGKSSRQVEELLASVDPSLTSPREQLRARGDGTWTFTVVVDRECRHGLDQLKALLSHVDPAMSYGQLVNRLVQDELRRRDPRPHGSTGTDTRPAATDGSAAKRTMREESAGQPGGNGAATTKPAAATAGAASASNRDARADRNGAPAGNGTAPAPTGRSVPAVIKRAVWERDQGRCSYVDPTTGRRCSSRHLLQIDHIRPWARGGSAQLDNLRLLCHAHHRHRHTGPNVPRPETRTPLDRRVPSDDIYQ